jgi:hypothetical protein
VSRWLARLDELQAQGSAALQPQAPTVQNVQNVQKGHEPPSFERFERFEQPYPSAGTADAETFEERAALIEYGAGVPLAWAEGFARLNCLARPGSIPAHRWRHLIDNAGRFIDQWAAKAIALGWRAPEIFGCHPEAPTARYDMQGLVWVMGEGEVIGITDATATIRSPNGYVLTFCRVPAPPGERVALIWELGSRLPPNRGMSGPTTEAA